MNTMLKNSEGKATKTTAIGSVFSGGLAAACCLGPAMFMLLGIGGVGLTAGLMQYRTPLMIVSVLFLGTGFYFAYRKPRECSAGCQPPASKRVNKIIIWVAAVFVVGFSVVPYLLGEDSMESHPPALASGSDTAITFTAAPAQAAEQKSPETVPLAVKGMTCVSCEPTVKKALASLPGVSGVMVSYKKGEAVIEYDPAKVTPEQMIDAVNKAGYSASPK